MINIDREDLRLLITEFNDGPMGTADDFAWRRHLKTYDDLLAEVKRLRKAFEIEEQIVQAFYEYREECCFDHCEAWMLENGHRVMVKIDDDEQSEWKVEVEE